MSKDFQVKVKGKKKMHCQWKEGRVSWEVYRNVAWLRSDGLRKAKVQLELNSARDTKEVFYRYVSQEEKLKESVPSQGI